MNDSIDPLILLRDTLALGKPDLITHNTELKELVFTR